MHSLIRSDTTHKQSKAAVACPHAWVVKGEVWLHDDFFRGQTTGDELAAREVGEGDVDIDAARPCAHDAVNGKHASQGASLQPAAAVTRVQNTGPRDGAAQTVFADQAFPIEQRTGAN